MRNFVCSECGMTNLDYGSQGYKTPREVELEQENSNLKSLENLAYSSLKNRNQEQEELLNEIQRLQAVIRRYKESLLLISHNSQPNHNFTKKSYMLALEIARSAAEQALNGESEEE